MLRAVWHIIELCYYGRLGLYDGSCTAQMICNVVMRLVSVRCLDDPTSGKWNALDVDIAAVNAQSQRTHILVTLPCFAYRLHLRSVGKIEIACRGSDHADDVCRRSFCSRSPHFGYLLGQVKIIIGDKQVFCPYFRDISHNIVLITIVGSSLGRCIARYRQLPVPVIGVSVLRSGQQSVVPRERQNVRVLVVGYVAFAVELQACTAAYNPAIYEAPEPIVCVCICVGLGIASPPRSLGYIARISRLCMLRREVLQRLLEDRSARRHRQ